MIGGHDSAEYRLYWFTRLISALSLNGGSSWLYRKGTVGVSEPILYQPDSPLTPDPSGNDRSLDLTPSGP